MARRKRTEEIKVEEIKKEVIESPKKEIKPLLIGYKIKFPAGWLVVRNKDGESMGIIENGTEIKGVEEGNKIKFTFDGHEAYVLKSCVE